MNFAQKSEISQPETPETGARNSGNFKISRLFGADRRTGVRGERTSEASGGFGAVNRINMAGDIGRVVGGEKGKQSRHFFRLGMAAERDLAIYFLEHRI